MGLKGNIAGRIGKIDIYIKYSNKYFLNLSGILKVSLPKITNFSRKFLKMAESQYLSVFKINKMMRPFSDS